MAEKTPGVGFLKWELEEAGGMDLLVEWMTNITMANYRKMRSITGSEAMDLVENIVRGVPIGKPAPDFGKVATGTKLWDWEVPPVWHLKKAWLRDGKGLRLIDMTDEDVEPGIYSHPLQVVNYSAPLTVRAETMEDLLDGGHIYTGPALGDSDIVPYVTAYYDRSVAGLCLSRRQLNDWVDRGPFEIFIDSEFSDGYLRWGEVVIPGRSNKFIQFSSNICHPGMANNETIGPVILGALAGCLDWLVKEGWEPNYTYRILFLPETIGALAYLDSAKDTLTDMAAGYTLSCMSVPNRPGAELLPLSYKRSRRGDTLADQIACHVMQCRETPIPEIGDKGSLFTTAMQWVSDFEPIGSDERQFCAPGFNLPVGAFYRQKPGSYPEYHTSLDDGRFVNPDALRDSLEFMIDLVHALEVNGRPVRKDVTHGEPMLSKRGWYSGPGEAVLDHEQSMKMRYITGFSQATGGLIGHRGRLNKGLQLFEIADKLGIPVWELEESVNLLGEEGIIYVDH